MFLIQYFDTLFVNDMPCVVRRRPFKTSYGSYSLRYLGVLREWSMSTEYIHDTTTGFRTTHDTSIV